MPRNNVYRDGKVHVMREECATCIFRPHTRPVPGSRVAEMVLETKDEPGATVVCHKTLYPSDTGEEDRHAICRGWYDRLSDRDPVLRLAKSMNIIQEQGQEEDQ